MRKLILLLAFPILILSGCAESVGPGDQPHVGSYQLLTVNGEGLPTVVYQDATITFELAGGTFVLNADRTFSSTLTWTIVEGESTVTEVDTMTGVYTIFAGELTFQAQGGNVFGAFIQGNTLTLVDDFTVAVFERSS
jgi:hypothetical protein